MNFPSVKRTETERITPHPTGGVRLEYKTVYVVLGKDQALVTLAK
jgi:hypothetical protein